MSTLPKELPPPPTGLRDGKSHPRSTPSPREQFIPLRKADLVETLAGTPGLSEAEQRQLRRFCRLLDVLLHCEYQAALEELKNAYAPFDPDADTPAAAELSPGELDERADQAVRQIRLAACARQFRAPGDRKTSIDRLTDRSQWGLNLHLNFEIFDRLEVYCRGDVVGTRFRRRLTNRFRSEAGRSADLPAAGRHLSPAARSQALEVPRHRGRLHQALQGHSQGRSRHAAAGHASEDVAVRPGQDPAAEPVGRGDRRRRSSCLGLVADAADGVGRGRRHGGLQRPVASMATSTRGKSISST